MKRLKDKWGIESNLQIIIILIVFSITGSLSVFVARPIIEFIGLTKGTWYYWPIRILIIFPVYQIMIVIIGAIFGQFKFFWNMQKKILKRMGLGFLFD